MGTKRNYIALITLSISLVAIVSCDGLEPSFGEEQSQKETSDSRRDTTGVVNSFTDAGVFDLIMDSKPQEGANQ